MGRQIVHRLLVSFPALLGVLFLCFCLLQVVPADPAMIIAGPDAKADTIAAIRLELGLDRPIPIQFADYIGRVLRGDLGRSIISNKMVSEELALTIGPTVELMLGAMLIAVPLGLALGTLAAVKRGTLLDRLIMAISVAGVSMPVFFIGLILIQYVGFKWALLPFTGRTGPVWDGGLPSLILPAVTLGAVLIGPIARLTRTAVLEVLGADYVRTARAKGLRETVVIVHHALRNALIPVVTLIGLQAAFLLGGAVVTETMFSWPGVGTARRRRHRVERFPDSAGRHHDPRHRLPDHQPAGRRALRLPRSQAAAVMSVEALDAPVRAEESTGALSRSGVLRRLARDKVAVIAALLLTLIGLAAIFAPVVAPYDPYLTDLTKVMQPPSEQHWFGTDNTGRDILSRVIFGTRNTLMLGLVGVIIGGLLGGVLGILAAYYPRADGWIMRLVDVMLAFPAILIGLAVAAVAGAGLGAVVIALVVATVPDVARVARGAAVGVMGQEFMEAGRAVGVSDRTLIWRYLTLNCISTIFVFLTLRFGQIILVGSALGFLGMGAQPPTAELGMMAAQGRDFLFMAPHIATIPSCAIFVIVLAANLLGDALRDVLDPRLQT